MHQKIFITFVESFDSIEHHAVIQSIIEGYQYIFGGKDGMGAINPFFPEYNETPQDVKPASAVNYMQNLNNEYFKQTIPTDKLNIVNSSQSGVRGGRTIGYPPSGRTSDSLQNIGTRRNLAVQNSNGAPDGAGPTVGSGGTVGLGYATAAGGA